MRVMSFIQVLLLLTLLAYVLLVSLENPGFVRLPLPMGQGEWLVSTGIAVSLFLLLGGLYVLTLVFPILMRSWSRGRQGLREKRELERLLVSTLGARLQTGAATPEEAKAVQE